MSVANYAEAKILDHCFGGAAFAQPAACFAQLHTDDPGEDCTANVATNTTRQAVTFAAAANPGGTKASSADVSWTNCPANETYAQLSLWDAETDGNALWYGALTTPRAVTIGATFTIASGDLVVSLG